MKVHWQIGHVAEKPTAAVFCYFTDRKLSWLLLPNPNKLCTRLQSSARHGQARARASTNASHPSTTITTSIEMEEPSQPSCYDMFATSLSALVLRWLPCTLYPPASQAGATHAACGLLGSKHCYLRRHAGRYILERDNESSLHPLASLKCATRPPGLTDT